MENNSLIEKLKLVRKLNAGLWGWPDEKVQLKEAEDLLTALVSDFPENTLVLTNIGALKCDQGKYEEAIVFLKKAEGFEADELSLVAYFDPQGY